ncbi:unnamed protein product [Caenorhabditis angaria]|uniref:Uncharacterized protein n=1 Tax=Caenorhabditis angaria TaxID=860376 RepID=A0A9P1ICU0_9PELO|nr:unnamed protein product [Caenorhabditis angaria]
MSSVYVPLVIRLEVATATAKLATFSETSTSPNHLQSSPSAAERTRKRLGLLTMKRVSPPKSKEEAPVLNAENHQGKAEKVEWKKDSKGRRTYSEVVVEHLDGDKLIGGGEEGDGEAGTSLGTGATGEEDFVK